jgi:hypothetical protein
MLKKIFLSLGLALLLLLTAGISIYFSVKSQREAFAVQLEAGQAMLWFNHLKQFQEIESYLSRGCVDQALELTKIAKDQEMKLLADFQKRQKDTWVNEYISKRDPNLLAELATFKSAYGSSWKTPKCAR